MGEPFAISQYPVLKMPPVIHIQCRFSVPGKYGPHDNSLSRQVSLPGFYKEISFQGCRITADFQKSRINQVKKRTCLPYQHLDPYGGTVRLQVRQSR